MVSIKPIFIIGAGRSGTNILRDTLTSFEELITWPCDEINLIFRHGNRSYPHDRFEKEHATNKVKTFVQNEFQKLQGKHLDAIIVEKTCANSLRIPFLLEIFPEAKFIFIVRDGKDVTASAIKRWTGTVRASYIIDKLKFVPLTDIPFYAIKFISHRLRQLLSKRKELPLWGPIYPNMEEDRIQFSLEKVCAKQWEYCFSTANSDLESIPEEQKYLIRYEDLVQCPELEIKCIGEWLGMDWSSTLIKENTAKISKHSVGKGSKGNSEGNAEIQEIIEQVTLPNLKYDKI